MVSCSLRAGMTIDSSGSATSFSGSSSFTSGSAAVGSVSRWTVVTAGEDISAGIGSHPPRLEVGNHREHRLAQGLPRGELAAPAEPADTVGVEADDRHVPLP